MEINASLKQVSVCGYCYAWSTVDVVSVWVVGLGNEENRNASFSLIMKSIHIVEVA